MFDPVKFGVKDYAASKAFFLNALEPLGVAAGSKGPPTYGIELSSGAKASLCLFQTKEKRAKALAYLQSIVERAATPQPEVLFKEFLTKQDFRAWLTHAELPVPSFWFEAELRREG